MVDNMNGFLSWCKAYGITPTEYDNESLSYYQCLCKLTEKVSECIKQVNTNEENYEQLQKKFTVLKTFVNTYFDNLDVQREIDKKLDVMVKDGTFSSLIQPIFLSYTTSTDNKINQNTSNIAELKQRVSSFENLPVGSTTADAEIIAARIDNFGNQNINVGDNIRNSISNLYSVPENLLLGTRLVEYIPIGFYNSELVLDTNLQFSSFGINVENLDYIYFNIHYNDVSVRVTSASGVSTFNLRSSFMCVKEYTRIDIPVPHSIACSVHVSEFPLPINFNLMGYHNLSFITDTLDVSEIDYSVTENIASYVTPSVRDSTLSFTSSDIDPATWGLILNDSYNIMGNRAILVLACNNSYCLCMQTSNGNVLLLPIGSDLSYQTLQTNNVNFNCTVIRVETINNTTFNIYNYYTNKLIISYTYNGMYNLIPMCGWVSHGSSVKTTVHKPSDNVIHAFGGYKKKTRFTRQKFSFYGTSMTDNKNDTGCYTQFMQKYMKILCNNKGKAGSGIIPSLHGSDNVKSRLLNDSSNKNSDWIVLEVIPNDRSGNLGTLLDTGDSSFLGNLSQCIKYVQSETNANLLVLNVCTTRYQFGDPSVKYTPDSTEGYKIYRWKQATKEMCELYGCYYLDVQQNDLGYWRISNGNKYVRDQIHLTLLGGYNVYEAIRNFLNTLPDFKSELPNS